mgnify:CR=1 FL=1
MSSPESKPPALPLENEIDHLFRVSYGKMVAYLTSYFGPALIGTAEDIAQETLLEAYRYWGFHGLPRQPEAWLFHVAKNKALNSVKRRKKQHEVYDKASNFDSPSHSSPIYLEDEIKDSMLRMMFACCHPSLAANSQLALILNTLCGFSRKEIANALLSKEETIKKRLYRAKSAFRGGEVILDVPRGEKLKERLTPLLTCLYLMFNEGYNATHSTKVIRKDLCLEAMRLNLLVVERFPENTSCQALYALMCLHAARFESRIDEKGVIVLFQDQDRKKWNSHLIQAGLYYLSSASKGKSLSAYHIEASIAAQHCSAASFAKTNWPFIHRLYQLLYQLKPSPIIQLNLAIVAKWTHGIEEAIGQLLELEKHNTFLQQYYLLFASLGVLYLEKNEKDLAKSYLEKAKSLCSSTVQQQLLIQRLREL